MIAAPGDGVTTTDLSGNAGYNPSQDRSPITNRAFTDEFDGTSAATPIVAGVIALMLEANPNLGWRDVAEILLRSGQKISPTDADWVSRSGGNTSLPPIKHNHRFGGGLVNAASAVALATSWTPLGTRTSVSHGSITPSTTFLEDGDFGGITVSDDFSSDPVMRVEQVQVTVDITHMSRGNLEIDLISPSGITSRLITLSPGDSSEDGYPSWTFSSNRHWGESSKGVWRVNVRDILSGDIGDFNSVKITLHGEVTPAPQITSSPPAEQLYLAGTPISLTTTATGFAGIRYRWARNGTVLQDSSSPNFAIPSSTAASAGLYTVTATNFGGSDVETFRIGIVTPPPAATITNIETTLSLSVTASLPSGATASYQWRKDGTDISNDPPGPNARISGATARTLNILRTQTTPTTDAGAYDCIVKMGVPTVTPASQSVTTPVTNATIRLRPNIQLSAFPPNLSVSGAYSPIDLQILHGVTQVVISGLPAGMTYNPLTGVISGTPDTPVNNVPIQITATNLAGSTTITLNLTVAPLALPTVGIFDGTVARDPSTASNSNSGGSVSLTTLASGTFTGRLALHTAAYPFSGRFAASTTADPTGSAVIRRAAPLTNLTLSFSINRVTGKLTGQITDVGSTFTTPLTAGKRTPNLQLGARQNIILDPTTPVSSASAPSGSGAGHAVITSSTGAVTVTLKLADGTVTTRLTSLGSDGMIPVFNMLYANQGSILGHVQITDAISPAPDLVTGSFTWRKTGPASAADRVYASGFDFGVGNANALVADGSEYSRPVAPTILWGLTAVTAVPSTNANARLNFTGASIDASAFYLQDPLSINRDIRIMNTHAVTVILPNPAGVRGFLNVATGEISGSMILRDGTPSVSRTVSYYGVVSLADSTAKGWFLSPQLPVTTTQAGAFQLNALP
jgi:subtilisin-like proprotein convertase family protein